MGAQEIPTSEEISELVKNIKKNNGVILNNQDYHYSVAFPMAAEQMREEFLDAIAPALANWLNIVCGDVSLLSDEERRLLDVYGSWDRYNHGNRKIVAELIEDNKDDTWGGHK